MAAFKPGDVGKTRGGRVYRILATDIRGNEPIAAAVENWDGNEVVETYRATGAFWHKRSTWDLMPPESAPDPRDPDYSREGIFVYHNCARCNDGRKPCVKGNPRQCEYPHARND